MVILFAAQKDDCCKWGEIWGMKQNVSFSWYYEKQIALFFFFFKLLQEATFKKKTKLQKLISYFGWSDCWWERIKQWLGTHRPMAEAISESNCKISKWKCMLVLSILYGKGKKNHWGYVHHLLPANTIVANDGICFWWATYREQGQ